MADHLALRNLIATQLNDCVTGLRAVYFTPTLDYRQAPHPFSPVAFIYWAGDDWAEGQRYNQPIDQDWLIDFGVEDQSEEAQSGIDTASAAGQLLDSAIRAFVGWTPNKRVYSPFRGISPSLGPAYFPGFIWAPLQIQTDFIVPRQE